MLTRDDLIDIIVAGLAPAKPAMRVSAATPSGSKKIKETMGKSGPAGRVFLSEHEIKRLLTPGSKRLTIPGNSIVSPLALEWLTLKGIEIVRG